MFNAELSFRAPAASRGQARRYARRGKKTRNRKDDSRPVNVVMTKLPSQEAPKTVQDPMKEKSHALRSQRESTSIAMSTRNLPLGVASETDFGDLATSLQYSQDPASQANPMRQPCECHGCAQFQSVLGHGVGSQFWFRGAEEEFEHDKVFSQMLSLAIEQETVGLLGHGFTVEQESGAPTIPQYCSSREMDIDLDNMREAFVGKFAEDASSWFEQCLRSMTTEGSILSQRRRKMKLSAGED